MLEYTSAYLRCLAPSRVQLQRWRRPAQQVNVNRQTTKCGTETYTSNVARRRQAEATNETSTHVRQDVTVEVGHDHDTVRERPRVLDNLKYACK